MRSFKEFFKEVKNKSFLISILCLMLIQALLYFILKFFQHNYHLINMTFDNTIPFIPYSVYIYNLFYPFVFISFYYVFCRDKKAYFKNINAGIIGYLIADIIFLIYPTIINRPTIIYSSLDWLTAFVIRLTYNFDTPAINCFPSIHCLFCFQIIFMAIISMHIDIIKRIIIIFISLAIIASTLLIKQHYFYDILGAFGIFGLANIIVFLMYKYKIRK